MSGKDVEVVRRATELLVSAGPQAAFSAGLVAEDVRWRPVFEAAGGKTYVGIAGVEEFLREWTEDFEDWSFTVERWFEVGGCVVAELSQVGRGKGSGATVEFSFASVNRVRDGCVVSVDFYMTLDEALEAAARDAM